MSKRLASFGGPSAPSSSPIPAQSGDTTPTKPKSGVKNKNKGRDITPSSPTPSPRPFSKTNISSPSYNSKSSVHAPALLKSRSATASESVLQLYIRTALKRTAADLEDWDTLASRRAVACARVLVDKTTELENALSVLPEGTQPRSRMLGPRLRELNSRREELRGYLVDLDVSFARIAERTAGLEIALAMLTQRDGQELTESRPVWNEASWSFPSHVSHIAKVLRQLNRARYTLDTLAEQIIAYSLSSPSSKTSEPETKSSQPTFAQARTALASWSSEASRITEYVKEWAEVCSVEVPAWDEIEVGKEESEDEFEIEGL